MARINRYRHTGDGREFGKALFCLIDFKNGKYTFKGDNVAVSTLLGAGPYSSVNLANIVAGTGLAQAGSCACWFQGSLLSEFLLGATVQVDFIKPNLTAVHYQADMIDAGATYDTEWFIDESASYKGQINLYEASSGHPTRNKRSLQAIQLGFNRIVSTYDKRFLGGSINGGPVEYFIPRIPNLPIALCQVGSANSGTIEQIRFYRPILDLDLLQAMSRI